MAKAEDAELYIGVVLEGPPPVAVVEDQSRAWHQQLSPRRIVCRERGFVPSQTNRGRFVSRELAPTTNQRPCPEQDFKDDSCEDFEIFLSRLRSEPCRYCVQHCVRDLDTGISFSHIH